MRTPIDALITEKSLHIVSGSSNVDLFEHLGVIEKAEAGVIKNVCAKVSTQLADEIDGICALLAISKRRFLEAAMLEAVAKAKAIMDTEGVYEALEQNRVEGWSKEAEGA